MATLVSVVGCSHLDRRLFPVSIALQGHDPSEQLGPNTPDLHSAEGDPEIRNQNDCGTRSPGIQQPSEAAPERTSGSGEDGGGADDPVQPVRSRGKSWRFNYTATLTNHY